jgi:PIN domain nuclease of toxin-antitoxin system
VLLLDTHAWAWILEHDARRVGRRAAQLVVRAERQDDVRVSVVSIFEVSALHALGRLRLARSAEQWIRDAIERPGVRLAEVTPAIAIDAGSIPRTSLADPMDRLLVATARQLGATFLTGDTAILEYASRTSHVRAHDISL